MHVLRAVALIHTAAYHADVDPDRISFTNALHAARRRVRTGLTINLDSSLHRAITDSSTGCSPNGDARRGPRHPVGSSPCRGAIRRWWSRSIAWRSVCRDSGSGSPGLLDNRTVPCRRVRATTCCPGSAAASKASPMKPGDPSRSAERRRQRGLVRNHGVVADFSRRSPMASQHRSATTTSTWLSAAQSPASANRTSNT